MKKFFLVALSIVLLMSSCSAKTQKDEQIGVEEKIGQLLVVGFIGYEPSQTVVDAIEKYRIGGVIFFDANVSDTRPDGTRGPRNIESPAQTKRLVDSLQTLAVKASLPQLFIAIDQEGGRVNRLKDKYGFPASVSAAYQGKVNSGDTTRKYASLAAQTLAELGININYAPCVDLAVNPDNPIIAKVERSFGVEPDLVARHSNIWVEELGRKKILTSLKHYPGHGSSIADSHLGLTDITNTWSEKELEPYKMLIADGYNDIVMIGHLFNRNIDPLYPSSLSKTTLDILRNDIGYNGVIATDDMNMGAIINNYSMEKALELALNAGVDMIIMGNNASVFEPDLVKRTSEIIKGLVDSGKVSLSRIDEAYNRIMALKSRLK